MSAQDAEPVDAEPAERPYDASLKFRGGSLISRRSPAASDRTSDNRAHGQSAVPRCLGDLCQNGEFLWVHGGCAPHIARSGLASTLSWPAGRRIGQRALAFRITRPMNL